MPAPLVRTPYDKERRREAWDPPRRPCPRCCAPTMPSPCRTAAAPSPRSGVLVPHVHDAADGAHTVAWLAPRGVVRRQRRHAGGFLRRHGAVAGRRVRGARAEGESRPR
ncbi:hypothetical protein AB5J72_47170 [Streptomyces sp. CG1]|uniref:hypothetical protein n=1 Tax=Streptomyces sp. CG1 TaxID=1287523 RepID=UPI0034E2F05A